MSLFAPALFDAPQPVSSPLAPPSSFLDRYRFSQGFPDVSRLRPAPIDWSMIGDRGSYAPVSRAPNIPTGAAFGTDMPAPSRKTTRDSKVDDLLRQSGAIIDNWGDGYDPQADDTPIVPKRRAMTPLEGPDTGDENPNAGTLPQGYFSHLRGPEGTKDNYNAVNSTTGATGPYQFLPSTWGDLMKNAPQLGLTWEGFYNPSKNKGQHDAAIQEFTDRNARMLAAKLGRAPTAGELYATHLLGGAGGSTFLGDLDAPAGSTIPGAVFDANPWMRPYLLKPGRRLLSRLESMMSEE